MPLLRRLQQPYGCAGQGQALSVPQTSPRCLIVAGNVTIGYQVASLLSGLGWRIDVVHNDFLARDTILTQAVDVVVADIATDGLDGLSFLALCSYRFPGIATYAIVQGDDAYGKRVGRDAGGCQGFFYLMKGGLRLDLERGMAMSLADMGRVLATGDVKSP